jgi:hypothetical protein
MMLAVALAVTLSACGSAATPPTSASSGASDPTSSARFQARLSLAKCFRAHGINVPDPSANGGPAEGGGAFKALQSYPQSQIQSVMQSCQQYVAEAFPRVNLSPAQQAQFRAQLTKFAECMRSHGINVPDPTTNGVGGAFGFRQAFRSIDRNSPAFQAAVTACQSLRPHFGRGGPGPGPAPGGGSGA